LGITYKEFKSPEPYTIFYHPQFLKQYNNRWFVFGKNENPPQERENIEVWTLSLDRILTIAESDHPYLESEMDWEEDYFFDIIGVTRIQGQEPEEIKLWFSPKSAPYVFTKPLHHFQKPKWLEGGELEIRIRVIPNYELESVILSFGENTQVLEPEWLKEKIATRLKGMLSRK